MIRPPFVLDDSPDSQSNTKYHSIYRGHPAPYAARKLSEAYEHNYHIVFRTSVCLTTACSWLVFAPRGLHSARPINY